MIQDAEVEGFARLFKENKELSELLHDLSHAALSSLYYKGNLGHLGLCEIIASTFCAGLCAGVDLTNLNTNDIINQAMPKIDISKFN
jgi:hypothetical protein